MQLIPAPKALSKSGKEFIIGSAFDIVMDTACGFPELAVARLLKTEIENAACTSVSIDKSIESEDADLFIEKTESAAEDYSLEICEDSIKLSGGERGIFLGAQTLRQIIRQSGANLPGVMIKDEPYFKVRGFMHDVTRGKVPKLKTLYELADRASFYKLNQIQLYVEHSFAFKNFSEAYAGKDPLTAQEILEFDAYCAERHIELVPCLATFGHLYVLLSTKSFSKYSELEESDKKPFSFCDRMLHHTLNVSDDESFGVVKQMIDEFLPLFSSKHFNICCDETFDIGKGKSAGLAAKVGEERLYVDFLKKIIDYVQGKGKKVMFWGDIILKNPDFLNELQKDADCLYWNYDSDIPENEIQLLARSNVPFYGCPGVCGWNHMMNMFDVSYENIKKMAKYSCKYGAKGILCTDWGDYGHVNFFANSMPGLSLSSAFSWNPEEERGLKKFMETYSLLEYGAAAKPIAGLLCELAGVQIATWADIVWWRESQYTDNENALENIEHTKNLDETKALNGYRRALEIEAELAAFCVTQKNRQDIREFICSAHGAALFNAAGLAIKKSYFRCGKKTAVSNCSLAADIEKWFSVFAELWRERNKESELNRISETLFSLTRALREWE